jgi:DNA-directed RNA polymerase specialized sigma24 family protein
LLSSSPLPAASRSEHLALAARVLRQVLVDHHRARSAEKRGGASSRVELDPELSATPAETVDVAAIHAALARLAVLNARQAEVVTLRWFGGLTMEQVAATRGRLQAHRRGRLGRRARLAAARAHRDRP